MAAISDDFLVCDDMDVILSLIEEDIAWEDENFIVEVNNIVGQLNETTPDSGFPCELCEKVCKSQHGLTRYKTPSTNNKFQPLLLPLLIARKSQKRSFAHCIS